jgi:hypothetical protein
VSQAIRHACHVRARLRQLHKLVAGLSIDTFEGDSNGHRMSASRESVLQQLDKVRPPASSARLGSRGLKV